MSSRPTRRRTFLANSLASGAAAAVPLAGRAQGAVVLDDASHLNATPVARHVVVKSIDAPSTIETLRRELKEAAQESRPVAMGAARHSMGGQSLARNGTVFTFATPTCEPDRTAGLYRAAAGVRWNEVIATLDPIGYSPKVLQANNDFGVASTFSVNAHGWAVPHAPFGSTVRSFRIMLADGTILTCSRTENRGLFRHVMGGYGLLGIILDLDVEMVPNRFLQPATEALPAASFGERFPAVCTDPSVSMAYGRLDVSRDSFFQQALLISYRPHPNPPAKLPVAEPGGGVVSYLSREIYRAEVGSDWGKRLRWFMETDVGPWLDSGGVTRNSLLNWPASALDERNPKRTDILHEYFVPPDRFRDFLTACREVIPKSGQDLLNVTLRFLEPDTDSVLAYAPTRRISAVMSFSVLRTAEADLAMQRMTRDLIDRILAIGGSFYLPYRLHARPDQVAHAYPAIAAFAAFKRQLDPNRLFRNALWDTWLEALSTEKK